MIGVRATQKAVLAALLEPTDRIRDAERQRRFADRLALMDEARTLPYAAVWNRYCLNEGVPAEQRLSGSYCPIRKGYPVQEVKLWPIPYLSTEIKKN